MHRMALSVSEELLAYVGFGPDDAEALQALEVLAQPHLVRIAEQFYARILEHPDARQALEGGEATVGRLKVLLVQWMESTLRGPWDAAYFERRARIGRAHVRIALPQHYMFGGMDLLRRELATLVEEARLSRLAWPRMRAALDRILDVELGIMLHSYEEDREVQRLKAVRTLTAGLSHEIRNPLNAASLQLAVLERRIRRMPQQDQADSLQPLVLVRDEIRRLDRLLEDFLQFARPHELAREPVVLETLVQRVADLSVHRRRAPRRPAGAAPTARPQGPRRGIPTARSGAEPSPQRPGCEPARGRGARHLARSGRRAGGATGGGRRGRRRAGPARADFPALLHHQAAGLRTRAGHRPDHHRPARRQPPPRAHRSRGERAFASSCPAQVPRRLPSLS